MFVHLPCGGLIWRGGGQFDVLLLIATSDQKGLGLAAKVGGRFISFSCGMALMLILKCVAADEVGICDGLLGFGLMVVIRITHLWGVNAGTCTPTAQLSSILETSRCPKQAIIVRV